MMGDAGRIQSRYSQLFQKHREPGCLADWRSKALAPSRTRHEAIPLIEAVPISVFCAVGRQDAS